MPMVVPTVTRWPSTRYGSLTTSISRCASTATSCGDFSSGQHGELIAAEPGGRIALADDAFDALRHLLQQPVADRVAQRVVDQLEVVEIDAQRADEAAGAAALRQGVGHALAEQHAVGQVGERVVVRHVGDARLGRLALGDVDDGDEHSRRALVVELARENDDLDGAPSRVRCFDVLPNARSRSDRDPRQPASSPWRASVRLIEVLRG